MTTTAQVQADILNGLGEDATNTILLARALRWANKAYDKLVGFLPEAEFFQKSETEMTTIADQATYVMPSNWFQIVSFRDDTNSTIIAEITRQEFDRLHSDPSNESTGKPSEYTLEYDHVNKRMVIRMAPIPDDSYTCYATVRMWPDEMSSTKDPIYDKLRTALEEGGIYEGAKVIFADPEHSQYRIELQGERDAAFMAISRIVAKQKPNPPQVPIAMRKNR